MKNLVLLLILLLGGIGLALWSPWLDVDISISDIFGVEEPDQIAGLQVFSLAGDLEVSIDGESKGTVSEDGASLIVDRIDPGTRLVTIERESTVLGAYWKFNKIIDFEEGKDVIISYNIGPEEEFSEGTVISSQQSNDTDTSDTTITIRTSIENATVTINDVSYNLGEDTDSETQISKQFPIDKQYSIVIEKDGFETLEFTLLPANQEDRNRFGGFEVIADVQLMYQPIDLN